jgi:hypothetical protein
MGATMDRGEAGHHLRRLRAIVSAGLATIAFSALAFAPAAQAEATLVTPHQVTPTQVTPHVETAPPAPTPAPASPPPAPAPAPPPVAEPPSTGPVAACPREGCPRIPPDPGSGGGGGSPGDDTTGPYEPGHPSPGHERDRELTDTPPIGQLICPFYASVAAKMAQLSLELLDKAVFADAPPEEIGQLSDAVDYWTALAEEQYRSCFTTRDK